MVVGSGTGLCILTTSRLGGYRVVTAVTWLESLLVDGRRIVTSGEDGGDSGGSSPALGSGSMRCSPGSISSMNKKHTVRIFITF